MAQIDHVFVLMLENRSFDHFFGLSGRAGIQRPTDPEYGPGATDQSAVDPPHEFPDVQAQLNGGAMDGFAQSTKLAFVPSQIPVISELANNFLLFDNWYSSLPGPTWPNRFFVHAASSGGLAASPRALDVFESGVLPSAAFQFQNGTIFDRLNGAGKSWRVYHGDVHPQVLSLKGMVANNFNTDLFRPIDEFVTDLDSGSYDVAYTFIEPNYAIQLFSQFVHGDSQHPRGFVSAGERLIKLVYETIRNSNVWSSSLLLIAWDEHGGFYDQSAPPAATPPADEATNRGRAGANSPVFAFDKFGVRVPALLVSPWVRSDAKLGSQVFPGKVFDHSSVVSSLREQFGLGVALTKRDATAPTWSGALGAVPRTGADSGPTTLGPVSADLQAIAGAALLKAPASNPTPEEPDAFIEGVSLIALELDRFVSKQTGKSPLATAEFQRQILTATARTAATESGADFKLQLLAYIRQVDAKVVKHKARLRSVELSKQSSGVSRA